jgi:hypothetical protein
MKKGGTDDDGLEVDRGCFRYVLRLDRSAYLLE